MTDLTTGIGDTGGHGFGDAVNVLAEGELIVVAVRSGCTRQAQVQDPRGVGLLQDDAKPPPRKRTSDKPSDNGSRQWQTRHDATRHRVPSDLR